MKDEAATEEVVDNTYPLMLYRTWSDYRVVNNAEEAAQAAEEGYISADDLPPRSDEPETTPAAVVDTSSLAADLAAAEELIDKLDKAGAEVAKERDEARAELAEVKAKLESVEAENKRLAAEVAKVDPDGDGKVGGSVKKAAS